jgi:molecular chaperone GrpE
VNERDPENEGIRVNDKRRIDPDTLQRREMEADVESASVEADLGVVESKVAELTDDLRRVHAEYANYRKRVERDRETARDATVGSVLAELLPVLDDIERAREHGELDGAFRTVGENLEGIVVRLGLERFGAVGEEFDPALHEALTSEQRDGIDGPTVVNVYQPGYRCAGRVLRPARVGVADGA